MFGGIGWLRDIEAGRLVRVVRRVLDAENYRGRLEVLFFALFGRDVQDYGYSELGVGNICGERLDMWWAGAGWRGGPVISSG